MKKTLSIILIILIILCVGLFFVGKYSKQIKEFFSKDEENEILNNYGEISEEEALNFINKDYEISYILDKQTESVEDISKLLNNYPNNSKLYFLMLKLENEKIEVNKANIEKYAKDFFGSKVNLTHENIKCPICNQDHYIYDQENQEYYKSENLNEHELEKLYVYNHKIEFNKINNNYYLTVSKMYVLILPEFVENVFGSYSDYNENKNPLFKTADAFKEEQNYENYMEILPSYYEQNYKNYISLAPKYKYELQKENNKISVISFEIINQNE